MITAHNLAVFALVCDLLLGIVVLTTNPRRPTNLGFLIVTVAIGGWLTSIDFAFRARTAAEAEFFIRLCMPFGALAPLSFALLRMTIVHDSERIRSHVWRMRYWLLAGLMVAAISPTRLQVVGVRMPPAGGSPGMSNVPEAIYGGFNAIHETFLDASLLALLILLIRDQFRHRCSGIQRKELQFLLLGFLTMAGSILAVPLIEAVTHSAQVVRFAPLRIILFTAIIAYGITSRGILQVQAFFRQVLAYIMLAAFAGGVFVLSRSVFVWMAGQWGTSPVTWPSILAATLTSVLVNASSTPLRLVARKILPPSDIDFERTVSQVGRLVQRVTTMEELLTGFSETLSRAVGTTRVQVFLAAANGTCVHDLGGARAVVPAGDVILNPLNRGVMDLALEEVHRTAPTPERAALLARFESLDTDLIVPIRYHGQFSGIIVFGTRPAGRLYGAAGRATLRHIAELLGGAIANSRLYTEARQSQAYNQFLVDHLTCGVIATDIRGGLTIVNPKARTLLTLDEGAPAADLDLPMEIAGLIPPTLEGDFVGRDEEIILSPGARDEVHLRVSCLTFTSEDQQLLGAVLVLNDFTTVDRLQRQVRQADRLASIGTLASGMAHEIKNPLTTLKTFTQLLPKRFNDAEFRSDFTGLVGGEIVRIERIVNQLLSFARPAPLMIEQVNLHDIIDTSVKLVAPHAARQSIQVRRDLRSRSDFVAADKDQLQQVLLNLMLNAIQASENGSSLELSTESVDGDHRDDDGEEKSFIRLDVRDTGRGIAPDVLPHIFDPFFTTKSEGTGLGLSVSYNIIAEHKGRLEVTSELGKGTCFSIYLPVC